MIQVLTGSKRIDCHTADSFIKRTIGLMFRRKIEPLLFIFNKEKKYAFHTLFMLKTIGMVFINSNKKIVYKLKAEPFKLFIRPNIPFKYVLELQENDLDNFKIGQEIKIK